MATYKISMRRPFSLLMSQSYCDSNLADQKMSQNAAMMPENDALMPEAMLFKIIIIHSNQNVKYDFNNNNNSDFFK